MINKVRKTISKYNLLENGDKVVVALSGGPDSICLLQVLTQLAQDFGLSIIAAHFNHALRGAESDEDEELSREAAIKLGHLFISGKMDPALRRKGESPEEFYRRERYRFLYRVMDEQHAHKIALGHNLQDQAETVLLKLLRGSGLEGLKGILPKRNGRLIRPLIQTSRSEIIAFLDKTGVGFCKDSSNQNMLYLRNKVRCELIPYLKNNYNPRIEENLAQMAEILHQEDDIINKSVMDAINSPYIQESQSRISLSQDYIKKIPSGVRLRLYKKILEKFSETRSVFTFTHIQLLDNLALNLESGRKICLPSKIEARKEYDLLILERNNPNEKQIEFQYPVIIPSVIDIKDRDLKIHLEIVSRDQLDYNNKNKIFLDFDKLVFPAVIRNRRLGDRFQPLGMTGRQKIKDLFINRKIPNSRRNKILLFADSISVIWIEDIHINERVRIWPETKNILAMEIIKY